MSRVLNMITRGILRSSSATNGYFRELVMSLAGDDPPDVQHFQPYGLEARPPAGSEGVVMGMSGNADHLVALIAGSSAVDLADGETALYNAHGWTVELKQAMLEIVKSGVSRLKITDSEILLGTNPAALGVARVGDTVFGNITGTSATGGAVTGTFTGTITTGSTLVRSE